MVPQHANTGTVNERKFSSLVFYKGAFTNYMNKILTFFYTLLVKIRVIE